MKTFCKFSLFIALVLVLGCDKKKTSSSEPVMAPEPVVVQAKDGEEEGSLESRCFEGDPEACDELGH